MQTFSNMRRDSINYSVVNPTYILFGIAMVYGVLSPIFFYLTPLIGLSFYYLSEHFEEEERQLENLLIFIYIAFIEINRGLFLFSFLLFFLIFYKIVLKTIKESIVCKWCLPMIYITMGYLGYYLFTLFLSNIFNFEAPAIGWGYLVFIFTDIILAFILL
ncbi:MAG TPA: hypothetical protein EYG75_02895 [Campylobacterales bacterium]|nr:hypothetical protein [Campylobacterales bacterium]